MTEFIFMLTHHDVTVPSALETLEEIKNSGLRYIGCKDIGLSIYKYKELFKRMKRYDMETFLEVVTYNEEEHFKAVNLALKVGADNLIGGMPLYTKKTLDYLKSRGGGVKFFPYIGKVSGHPCILEGSIEEIVKNRNESEALGIDGINFLLYRYVGNHKTLLKAILKDLKVPLIVAGNVVSFNQIEELKINDIWAFTIGGAVFEKKFIEGGTLREQIEAILKKL